MQGSWASASGKSKFSTQTDTNRNITTFYRRGTQVFWGTPTKFKCLKFKGRGVDDTFLFPLINFMFKWLNSQTSLHVLLGIWFMHCSLSVCSMLRDYTSHLGSSMYIPKPSPITFLDFSLIIELLPSFLLCMHLKFYLVTASTHLCMCWETGVYLRFWSMGVYL